MISFKLTTDKFAAWMLKSGLSMTELLKVGGSGLVNYLRDWFFKLDASRANQLGGKRTHFYAQIARSVQRPKVADDKMDIEVNHVGLAQRWLGGVIKAGAGISSATGLATRYLAIPARAEAYGRTPAEFDDLSFVPPGAGHPAMLVENLQTGLKHTKKGFKAGEERGGLAMFWLVTQVNQKPDPSVMPSEAQIAEQFNRAVDEYLKAKG